MKELLRFRKLVIGTTVVFLFFILLLDKNSFVGGLRTKKEIDDIRRKKAYYQEKIRDDSTLLENLKDDAFLERYAREHFLMKRPGEQIYVIREK